MMRIRSNSKIIHAILAGKFLLFLFLSFPVLGFAVNDSDQAIDSLEYNSSTQINIYVSEGTNIYNGDAIYLAGDNVISVKETTKKHESTKITAVSKSLEKKNKKKSKYLQHRKVPVVTEHFNYLPLDPVSFFSKNNNKDTVLLPVNQQQIKTIGMVVHYVFYLLNVYRNKNTSGYPVNITSKVNQWQIHTRPPPYNII